MNIRQVIFQLPKQLPSRATHAAQSMPRGDIRSRTATRRVHELVGRRQRDGHDAGPAGQAHRLRLPGLARRRGVPRPRPRPQRRRRHDRPRRSHPHLDHGDHDLEIRNAPRRADLERGRDAAGRAAIAAGGQRQPVHEPEQADRADDDRRSERQADQAEDEDLGAQLPDRRSSRTGPRGSRRSSTVKTPAAGRISGSGTDLKFVTRNVSKATTGHAQRAADTDRSRSAAEIRTAATQGARRASCAKSGHETSKAFATVTFRS